MEVQYKYQSSNTLEFISLHDYRIIHANIDGHNLIWMIEAIDVLPEHPSNPYDMPKCTDEAQIIFEKFEVTRIQKSYGDCYDANRKLVKKARRQGFKDIKDNEDLIKLFTNLEILSVDKVSEINNSYMYYFLGDDRESEYLIEIEINFSNAKIGWNKYEGDSWFADRYKAKKDSK